MFAAALLTAFNRWEWHKCASADEWINTMWLHPYNGILLSRTEDTILPHAETRVNFADVMLSERGQI